MGSALCEISVNGGAYVPTAGGVDVAPGAAVVIRLASDSGARAWTCLAVNSDETSDADALNASITYNYVAKTASFTAPGTDGKTYLFESTVTTGAPKPIRERFGVFIPKGGLGGQRVLAADMVREPDTKFGWIAVVNQVVRAAGGGGGGGSPSGTGVALVSGGAFVGAAGPVNLASGTYVSGTLGVGNGGTGVTSIAAGMAAFWGTPSSANLAATVTDETGSGSLVFGTSPTFTTSFKVASGIYAYTFLPGALAANVNVSLPVLGSSDTFVFANLAQTLSGKIYASTTNPATTGMLRMGNGASEGIFARNNANSANACIAMYSSGDVACYGLDSSFANQAYGQITGASQYWYLSVGSQYYLHAEGGELLAGKPIVGDATVYGVHGQVTSAHTDANYTVPASEYKYGTIKFGTACTAGRTITFPAPASDAGAYEKEVVNTTGQTLTFNTGSGGKTLATGLAVRLRFTASEGTKYASATYTP